MWGNPKRNQPVEVPSENPVPRVLDGCTGDAGLDGYTRLAQADRKTGIRPMVGGTPVMWPDEYLHSQEQ